MDEDTRPEARRTAMPSLGPQVPLRERSLAQTWQCVGGLCIIKYNCELRCPAQTTH